MGLADNVKDNEDFSDKITNMIKEAFAQKGRTVQIYNQLELLQSKDPDIRKGIDWIIGRSSPQRFMANWKYFAFPTKINPDKRAQIQEQIVLGNDLIWAPCFNFRDDMKMHNAWGTDVFYFRYFEPMKDKVKLYRIPATQEEIQRTSRKETDDRNLSYKFFLGYIEAYLPFPSFD